MSTGVTRSWTFIAYTWCCSQFVAICSYSTVSPEFAGYFRTKKSRRQTPANNATIGLEKIRFIDESHLTIEGRPIERTQSREMEPSPACILPCRQAENVHEGTPTNILRRAARPLAPYAPRAGNFWLIVNASPGLFFRHHRGERRVA